MDRHFLKCPKAVSLHFLQRDSVYLGMPSTVRYIAIVFYFYFLISHNLKFSQGWGIRTFLGLSWTCAQLYLHMRSFFFFFLQCADFLNTFKRINSPFNAEEKNRHYSSTESKPRELQSTLGCSLCKPQGIMPQTQNCVITIWLLHLFYR